MSVWFSKRKLILLFLVCAAHAGLLWAFSLGKSSSAVPLQKGTATSPMLIQVVKNRSVSDITDRQPSQVASHSSETADTKPSLPAAKADPKPEWNQSPAWSGLPGLAYFLDAQAVDKTADPIDGFEVALAQSLPLEVESVVLEFWIEKDGRTALVRCIEGGCNEAVQASLDKLIELRFNPAVKEGMSVPSRKVIQIDPRPTFGM